eukprot:CAMPEP_0180260676 /NCGR_PEP_ID=MMETSP0987-20121128/43728_1 /TAXON_ID=697907 /ORGANISM="non described non described, Strain CCMP2293" /LENGTH=158 /DNA_ID=CAMNT_0022230561 /DNA_START=48 /DNA_END=524 /DNA_ORIENTATION=+
MTMIAKSRGALVGAFAAGIGGIVAAITVREYNVRESSASKIIDTLNGVREAVRQLTVQALPIQSVDDFARGALPHVVLAHGDRSNNAADPGGERSDERAARLCEEGLDGQLAYRFAHPIHKSDAPHIQRQITSAKIQNRQSEQYYGGYSGEYLAHKNA